MAYRKNILIFLTGTIIPAILYCQDVEFSKLNFPESEGLKEALKQIKIGDSYYDRTLYASALPYYLKADEFNPNNSELNIKIGNGYFDSDQREKAIVYFEKAIKLAQNNYKAHYFLGKAYHFNMEWDKAIKEYGLYLPKASPEEAKEIRRRQVECKTGKQLNARPIKVVIESLGDAVNTKYSEYAPLISADESVLIFMSRRPDSKGGEKDPAIDDFFEDLYISKNEQGNWTKAENIGEPVNSNNHDGAVFLSPDGQKLYIYRDDKGDGNIYECELNGDKWMAPKKLSPVINSKFQEPTATFTPDGRTIYFVSDKPEGSIGDKDIYTSRLNDKGEWSEPVNLGRTINTEYEEDGVFMHTDGKTLYFSSKGHSGMGGYDIFKTELNKGKWLKPQNIGFPINTPDDDIFFSISASGEHGYYSSVRKGGAGYRDLYRITWPMEKKDTIPPRTPQVTILKGVITDDKTTQPVEAEVQIVDILKNEIIANFKSNRSTGRYLISLPSGRNYGIYVTSAGYLFHSENVNIPVSKGYQEIVRDIALKQIVVGNRIVLNNIFFDFDKATLRPESVSELERLTQLMKDNGTMNIELSGHTDNKGSVEYNQTLSENRAKSVFEYLINNKINKSRLKYKGYGLSRPVATNETDEGRQLNRRTEFEVLSK